MPIFWVIYISLIVAIYVMIRRLKRGKNYAFPIAVFTYVACSTMIGAALHIAGFSVTITGAKQEVTSSVSLVEVMAAAAHHL